MERPLPPPARLEARELGARLHPIDQALMLLRLADPLAPEPLPRLPLAERDRCLLVQRRATFGDRMACLADCPRCGAVQEFELSAGGLIESLGGPLSEEVLEVEGWRIRLRPLESADLALAARQASAERAAAVLVAQAIVEAHGPDSAPSADLPESLWPILERRVTEREAVAEILLDLTCADCGESRSFAFDIGAHFWLEVEADARRLLGEVAALAERFGWSEETLLAMPAARRRAYLDLAGAP